MMKTTVEIDTQILRRVKAANKGSKVAIFVIFDKDFERTVLRCFFSGTIATQALIEHFRGGKKLEKHNLCKLENPTKEKKHQIRYLKYIGSFYQENYEEAVAAINEFHRFEKYETKTASV